MTEDIFELIRAGAVERVRALLDANAGLAAAVSADGSTPLGAASAAGQEKIVALLLARGADPGRASAKSAMPLHVAAAARSVAVARLLLGAGAPADARQGHDAGGSTPLMAAALNDDDEMVELLLRHGANPDLRDDRDMSAADHARMNGHEALADRLDRAAGTI